MTTQFLELYGTGLKNAAEMMSVTLESAQQLQRQQLDLFALQTRLAGAQFERAVDFWSRVWVPPAD
jgi:hypothetical protein